MTGKQRSYLKSLGHNLKPLSQVGKDGITENYLNDLNQLLEDHELVKISFLESFAEPLEESAQEIIDRSDAEFIQLIGRKLLIYRQSRTNPMLEIPGADNRRAIANKQRKEAQKKVK